MNMLTRAQQVAVVGWIGEGLDSGEIRGRALQFDPPFHVDKNLVAYYRRSRELRMRRIREESEYRSMKMGLALRSERVSALCEVAEMLRGEIRKGRLFESVPAYGIDKVAYRTTFHGAVITQFCKVLDQIAKEVGQGSSRKSASESTPPPLLDDLLGCSEGVEDIIAAEAEVARQASEREERTEGECGRVSAGEMDESAPEELKTAAREAPVSRDTEIKSATPLPAKHGPLPPRSPGLPSRPALGAQAVALDDESRPPRGIRIDSDVRLR